MGWAKAVVFGGLALVWGPGVLCAQQTPPNANTTTLEMLAREGYEIKAIQSATTRGFGFVVMLQRGAEVRTCLMRIERGTEGRPSKQSVCF